MFEKPRPKLLAKREAVSDQAAVDRRERQRCKVRSGMRCEVRTWTDAPALGRKILVRCKRWATHNHHLIAGIGRKNLGDSILAEHRLLICAEHHREIHGHVLKVANDQERSDAATVTYERIE